MAIRASHIFSSLLLACAGVSVSLGARAAELGEARVASHIGQQLVADVELTMIEDANAKVGVRLAHPDVYEGANIAVPAVLSGLNLSVMRRDGRQFLHLTTLKPVESRHLHVYLELFDGGQRSVRLVTLWLTPDPNPAQPAPLAVPAAVANRPAAVEAPRRPAPPRKSMPAARPAAALHDGEEYVEEGARPVPAAAVPPRKAAAKPLAAPARPAERKVPPLVPPVPPVALPTAQDAPATSAPQPTAGQLNACAVLGEKNTALRHELGQLEAKVKVLQAAAGGVPAAAAVPAAPPAPKGAPRIQLKPKKPAPVEPDTPWGIIGGAVAACLALAGLAVALLRRRKRSGFGKIPKEHKPAKLWKGKKAGKAAEPGSPDAAPRQGFMSAVKARLMPGSGKNPAPEPVEPALENADNQLDRGAHESVYTS